MEVEGHMTNITGINVKTKIVVITTGGTIEKSYDEQEGVLANRETFIKQEILQRLRLPYTELEIYPVLNMDSLFMEDEHREIIWQSISTHLTRQVPIVVIHGTDTMVQSANFCLRHYQIASSPVPIVFTGAMRPLGLEGSDARQNLAEALLAAQILGTGIYIAFHNRIFSLPNVRKNRQLGTFESC